MLHIMEDADTRLPVVRLSDHAKHRAREMSLSESSVIDVVRSPELDYPSRKQHHLRIACKGTIAAVYDPDTLSVLTILWHRGERRCDGPVLRRAA